MAAGRAATEFPAYVTALLDQLLHLLARRSDLIGLYAYGSLVTGDFSPSASDIDVVVLLAAEPDAAAERELAALHQSLRPADPAGQLHCLYVAADHASDAERLCVYWFGIRMTQWQMKLMTQAELASAGVALYGPWPPPGIEPVPVAAIQAAVHQEMTGYYRRMARRWKLWLDDTWVDHFLVALPRAAALLTTGDLITKGQAIGRLADFGVPELLVTEIADRRAGQPVTLTRIGKLRRGLTARRIMRSGVANISRIDPAGEGSQSISEEFP